MPSQGDPVAEIRRLTGGRGVDVAVEVIGLKLTMEQAVRSLAVLGRAVMVGIADKPFEIDSYRDLLGREAEVIGSLRPSPVGVAGAGRVRPPGQAGSVARRRPDRAAGGRGHQRGHGRAGALWR